MEKLTNEQKIEKAKKLSEAIEVQKHRVAVLESHLSDEIPMTEVYSGLKSNLSSIRIKDGLGEADDALLKFIQHSYLRQLKDLYSARLDRFQKEFDALWKN